MPAQQQIAIRPETIKSLDEAASQYQMAVSGASPFQKTFLLAGAMSAMRALLTPDVMQPIMALMNTDLGFRTDRDPNVKKKDGTANTPYSPEVVRDIVIEGTLRGYYVVNNEFNIIAGRFYAAKNGIRRRVTQWKGITDFKDTYGVPRNVGDKGSIVTCSATWKKDNIEDSLVRDIPVKVNDFMGADAILGKAERKLLKSVLDRISGEITPDGEVDTDGTTETSAPSKPQTKLGKTPPTVDVATTPVPAATNLPAQKGATHEAVTTQPGTAATFPTTPPPATVTSEQTPAAGEHVPLTDEDKIALAEEEARRHLLGNDPAALMVDMMKIDSMTDDELHKALIALGIKAPRTFKGPDSLLPDVIRGLLQTKAWQTIRSHVFNQREGKADTFLKP